jgi:hypothetical protein
MSLFQMIVVSTWLVAVAALFGIRFAMGVPLSMTEGLTALTVGIVPAAMYLKLFRNAPPRTIAEVLYTAERQAGPTEPSLVARAPED